MGDPRKTRKKYSTPSHPWQAERIEKEKVIFRDYGLKNKKEIWRTISMLKRFKSQVKDLISRSGAQAEKEEKQLRDKMMRMGLISEGAKLEDILDLNVDAIMERRLQTQVQKKGFAKTAKQARQFIVHGHVTVGDKKVTVPSYLLLAGEENQIAFKPTSALADPEHAERKIARQAEEEKKEEARKEELKEEKAEEAEKAAEPTGAEE